MRFRKLIY